MEPAVSVMGRRMNVCEDRICVKTDQGHIDAAQCQMSAERLKEGLQRNHILLLCGNVFYLKFSVFSLWLGC